MSFNPYVASPSASLDKTSTPLSSDGTPMLYWELAIKKAERAKAKASTDAEELVRQFDRNQPIEAKRYHKVGGKYS